MIKSGHSNLFYIQQQRQANTERRIGRDCSYEQNLNSSVKHEQPVKTIINNHFNITINVSPDTTLEQISALVEELTTIVDRPY